MAKSKGMSVIIQTKKIHVGERFREDYGDVDKLAESIKQFGMLQSVCVDSDYNLLDGGRRLAAAEKAGLTTVPVRMLDTTDPLVARQVELEENLERKQMTWEEEVRAKAEIDTLMKQIHGDAQETRNKADWSQAKTAKLVGEDPANLGRDLDLARALDVIPELKQAKNKHEARKMLKRMSEDLAAAELQKRAITLDEDSHIARAARSYNIGDALEGMSKIADPSVIAFAEVDPPYGINLADAKWRTHTKEKINADAYKEIEGGEYGNFIRKTAREVYRILAPHAWCVWWFGPTHYHTVQSALRGAGFQVDDIVGIWTKGFGQSKRPEIHLGRAYEPFFICRKGHATLAKPGRLNVFDFKPVAGQNKVHATERPVELMDEIVSTFSQPGDICIVPFLGSGVTLRSIYRLGRKGWGWDLSDDAEALKGKFLTQVEEDYNTAKDEE